MQKLMQTVLCLGRLQHIRDGYKGWLATLVGGNANIDGRKVAKILEKIKEISKNELKNRPKQILAD